MNIDQQAEQHQQQKQHQEQNQLYANTVDNTIFYPPAIVNYNIDYNVNKDTELTVQVPSGVAGIEIPLMSHPNIAQIPPSDSSPMDTIPISLATAYNVNMNMNHLSPPIASEGSSVIVSPTATTPTGNIATSTFKTPLLPMPTLEDIEGEMLLTMKTQQTSGGILSTPASTGGISGPLSSQQQQQQRQLHQLSQQSKRIFHQQPQTLIAQTSQPSETSNVFCNTIGPVVHTDCKLTPPNISAQLGPTSRSGSAGSAAQLRQITTTKSTCCTCFGSSQQHYPTKSKGRKRRYKRNSQSLCLALLTNLGMCALLLAYTLLGSFIFLTIENEHPLLLKQSTLASTTSRRDMNDDITHPNHKQSQQWSPTSAPVKFYENNNVDSMGESGDASRTYSSMSSIREFSSNDNNRRYNHKNTTSFNNENIDIGLSSDIYDVRQRTIENIWDITVSLNILYKENWTKLAALEIAKFQDQLIKRLNKDAILHLSYAENGTESAGNSPSTEAVLLHHYHDAHEWNFPKAFLYSVTVLTTIGYGNIAPRSTLGRVVTLAYAIFGIPLTLVYLSSTGSVLAKVAREVFSKALCCCLCSNCGYCCYDEKRMAEKERRMKRKRQLEELQRQQMAMKEQILIGDKNPVTTASNVTGQLPFDIDSLSESRSSIQGLSILAPILLCLSMMIIYIMFGALVLCYLEQWSVLDGIYFCFMSLSTIGFGDMLFGLRRESASTIWFCSIYILSGMALTAMCFNVIHEEIVHRIKIVVEFQKALPPESKHNDNCFHGPP